MEKKSIMTNLQTHYHIEKYLKNVDQHTGGKWLIQGTKRDKDYQLQMFKPIIKGMLRGGNIQGVEHLQNQNYLVTEILNV